MNARDIILIRKLKGKLIRITKNDNYVVKGEILEIHPDYLIFRRVNMVESMIFYTAIREITPVAPGFCFSNPLKDKEDK